MPRMMAKCTDICTKHHAKSAGAVPITAAKLPLAPTAAKNTCQPRLPHGWLLRRLGMQLGTPARHKPLQRNSRAHPARQCKHLQDDAGEAFCAGHQALQQARHSGGHGYRQRGHHRDRGAREAERGRQLAASKADSERDGQRAGPFEHLRQAQAGLALGTVGGRSGSPVADICTYGQLSAGARAHACMPGLCCGAPPSAPAAAEAAGLAGGSGGSLRASWKMKEKYRTQSRLSAASPAAWADAGMSSAPATPT